MTAGPESPVSSSTREEAERRARALAERAIILGASWVRLRLEDAAHAPAVESSA